MEINQDQICFKVGKAKKFKDTLEMSELANSNTSINSKQIQQKPQHTSINYRPDIDGLRTIAVGIVVIFHAWPKALTGGFIGVDVFFVISGYLISLILVKENIKGTFTYYGFYNRRVKRIYPALIFVLFFVMFLSIRYSDVKHLQMTTKTMAASTIFGANIEILTYKQGYFDPDVKLNPLLHLWSLGVEEQFYIIWPFLISLLLKRFRSHAYNLFLGYAILSFILNVIVSLINPKIDFYFPFCRFWQMAVGGILSLSYFKFSNLYAHILSVFGLLAILISACLLSERNIYPGWWSLFPTFGAAAIIISGTKSIINQLVLSNRLTVFIGKISYSLYIWHWPLLVFSRLLYPPESGLLLGKTWFIVFLSLIIKNPIRFRKEKSILVFLLVIMLLIGIASVIIYKNSVQIKQRIEIRQQQQDQQQNVVEPQVHRTPREKYEYRSIPRPSQDYYTKDDKNIPNWSRSQKRTLVSVKKIKLTLAKTYWEQVFLDKLVDSTSKYYRKTLPKHTKSFQVANQGQDKLVLLVGDSHAHYTSWRFAKLYEDAKKMNKTKELPTFVAILFSGTTFTPYEEGYKFVLDFIEEFKPVRVMFIYFWPTYKIYHGFQDFQKNKYNLKDEYFYENVEHFIKTIKNLINKGIQVTTNSYHPYGIMYDPKSMYDPSGIIENNIKPFKLNQFSQRHLAEHLETEVKKTGANIIHYTDHTCYNNICQVVSPAGYPVFYDEGHWTFESSRNWLTSVDFFIQFQK